MAVKKSVFLIEKKPCHQHRFVTNLIRIGLFYRQNLTSLGKNCNFALGISSNII